MGITAKIIERQKVVDAIKELVNHKLDHRSMDNQTAWALEHDELWSRVYSALQQYTEFCEGWPTEFGAIPEDPSDLRLRTFVLGPEVH